jgi:serine/threonine-protein kinase
VNYERDMALDARADAEFRRSQADALIAFMVGDLRKRLEPLGKLDVLDEVGERALRYFASLRPEEMQARDLRRNAQTLSQLGEVRMAQGNLAGAEGALRRSLELASAAARRDPADEKTRLATSGRSSNSRASSRRPSTTTGRR